MEETKEKLVVVDAACQRSKFSQSSSPFQCHFPFTHLAETGAKCKTKKNNPQQDKQIPPGKHDTLQRKQKSPT